MFSELTKANLRLRMFALLKIPLLSFCRPRVLALDTDHCVVRIPLRRRTRNHLNSMYFGALAVGADLCCGLLALEEARRRGFKVSLIFKSMQCDFLKRAEGDVHFTCTEGKAVSEMLEETLRTGERVTRPMPIQATVPSVSGTEPVAEFTLTLCLKRQGSKKPKSEPAASG